MSSQVEQSESTKTQNNWAWLKSVSRELYNLDDTPLLGYTPPFPWDTLTRELAKCFGLKDLNLEPGELRFREAGKLLEGIVAPHTICHASSPGLEGEVDCVISREDIHFLMSKIISLDPGTVASLSTEFIDSFSHFLHVETLYTLNNIGFDKKLSFKLSPQKELSQDAELCQDVWIQTGSERFLARIIINSLFRKSWQNYSFKAYGTKPSQARLEEIPIILHIEAGRTTLSIRKWATAKPGDLLLLDHAFYEPNSEKAKCVLTIAGKALFSASLQNGNLTIIEIPSHLEVYETMIDKLKVNEGNTLPHDEPPHEEDEGNIFAEDDEDLFEEEGDEEDNDEDEFELHESDAAHLESAHAEHTEHALPAEHKAAPGKEHKAPSKHKITTPASAPSLKVGEVSLNDIPITITCELAQFETSVQKLLELAPGNMLDLSITSDSAVLLVVNGKIIGKGEIIKIGDTLGVRILEIGSIEA